MSINAAIVDSTGLIINTLVLNSLSEVSGAVYCPPWLGIGCHITDSAPLPPLPIQAGKALSKSDLVVTRCYSAGVAVPTTWQTYRTALRNIVNGTDTISTTLPTAPAYPAGT